MSNNLPEPDDGVRVAYLDSFGLVGRAYNRCDGYAAELEFPDGQRWFPADSDDALTWPQLVERYADWDGPYLATLTPLMQDGAA